MTFELQYTDSKTNARAGLITTDHAGRYSGNSERRASA